MNRILPYVDLILIGFVIALTMHFTVEVPASDDWDLVPILEKIHEGTLDWKTLDTPYAGHKITVPYMLMGSVAYLTHWNSYVFRLVDLGILVGAWMAIRPIALRQGRLAETAILFWSFNQWACWLWTWMLMSALAIFCVLWSLRLMVSNRYRHFLLAMVLCVIGTFSWSASLAVWPAAMYLVFLIPRPRLQKVIFGVVIILTALLFIQHPAPHGDTEPGRNYFHIPLFFLLAVGAPVGFGTKYMAAYVSLIGLIMLILGRPSLDSLKLRPFTASLFLACLGMVGLLVCIRGGGPAPILGMDSRYGALCALFWVALILIVDWTGWKNYVLILIVFLCVVRDVAEVRVMMAFKKRELAGIQGIIGSGPSRFLLKGDHTTPDQFDADVRLMHEWHYSLFRSN